MPLVATLRAHPDLVGRPLAIAAAAGSRAEVVAVSPEAARHGVRPRTSVAHARALCAELCVRVASPALERAAREALLDAALSCSPRAELSAHASGAYAWEATAYLDASGLDSLFTSEAGLGAALTTRAQKLGVPVGVAVAASRSIARIAARKLKGSGDVCVVPPGGEAEFLAPQALDLLDPEDAVAERLTHFGLHTVGDLLALPRRSLGTRLGPEVLRMIAVARGETREAPVPVFQARALSEAIDLEFAVEQLGPLRFILRGLLSRLLARLEARHLACGELMLALALEDGGRDVRRVGIAAPTGDLRVLTQHLHQALEARSPRAAVTGVTLETEGSLPRSDQLDLFRPAGPAPAALGRTLAELEVLCGSDRIGAPAVADDHRPEAFHLGRFQPAHPDAEAAVPPAPPNTRRREPTTSPSTRPQAAKEPTEHRTALALRALRPPVTAAVRVSQGRPEAVRSAVANGRVTRLAGPWRTTGGWWTPEERFAYDSFDVQTSDGTVSRLRFDRVQRVWQIDAVYD